VGVEAAEQTILLQPNFYGAHFVLASALDFLGRTEEAKEALRHALKLMPRLSLKGTARNPMYVREDDVARMLEGPRRAGPRE
jgi:tetratricopeptide (TPR) repeat protein